MHPAPAPVSARTAVLLAAVVVLPSVTGLSACSLIGDSCHGTTAAKAQLAAQPILSAAPHGAAEPANYHGEGTTTGCDDDSPGKAWLHADRVYAYTGTPGDVIGYYEKTAPAAGWQREDPGPGALPAEVQGVCWTRAVKGRHLLLSVDFRVSGYTPPPAIGTGLAYEVSVGSNKDGTPARCWR
ncbi:MULTISPECIES: hypothetical protein [unclassified Streptomyces]|uniref:hypothetical protein n=1 Tax=unclassified Streptomyces TaxID=2593676 RepID=UPI002E2952B3|nr:hypothetical protein [Streptomyces sp. NBC_00223]